MEVADIPGGAIAPAPPAEPCVNCGTIVSAHFCQECGEKRASDRDNRLLAFCADAFHTVANVDGSFAASLKLLLAKPGELTRLHMRGRRVGLMRPLQLFFLLNVVYFVVAAATNNKVFMTTLPAHLNATWHEDMATRLVNRKLGDGTVTAAEYDRRFAAYREEFERVTAVQARSLIVIMVPALALLVGLLHLRRRCFAVQHLVYALHVFTAFLLLIVAVVAVVGLPLALLGRLTGLDLTGRFDTFFGFCAVALFAWYLYVSLRRAYGDSPWSAAWRTALLVPGVVAIVFMYRTVLFLTTYWAT